MARRKGKQGSKITITLVVSIVFAVLGAIGDVSHVITLITQRTITVQIAPKGGP